MRETASNEEREPRQPLIDSVDRAVHGLPAPPRSVDRASFILSEYRRWPAIWLWGLFLLAIMTWSVERGGLGPPMSAVIGLVGFLGSFAFFLVPVFGALPYIRAIRFGVLATGELSNVESENRIPAGDVVVKSESGSLTKRFTSRSLWLQEARVGDPVKVVIDSRRPRIMLVLGPATPAGSTPTAERHPNPSGSKQSEVHHGGK